MGLAMMPSLSNGFLAPYGFVIQDPRVGATEDMMIPCLPALAPIATPVPFGISFLHPIPTSAQPKETLHPSAARETVARAPLQKKPSSKTTNRQSVHSVAVQPRDLVTSIATTKTVASGQDSHMASREISTQSKSNNPSSLKEGEPSFSIISSQECILGSKEKMIEIGDDENDDSDVEVVERKRQKLEEKNSGNSKQSSGTKQDTKKPDLKEAAIKSDLTKDTTKSGLKGNTTKSGLKKNTTKSGLKKNTTKSGLKENTTKSGLKENTTKSDLKQDITKSDLKVDTARSHLRGDTSKSDSKEKTTESDLTEDTKNPDLKEDATKSDLKEDTKNSDSKEETKNSDLKEDITNLKGTSINKGENEEMPRTVNDRGNDLAQDVWKIPEGKLRAMVVEKCEQLRDLRRSIYQLLDVLVPELAASQPEIMSLDDDTVDVLLQDVLDANRRSEYE